MRRIIGSVAILALGAIVAIATTKGAAKDDLKRIDGYRSWHMASNGPVDMTPTMMLLCRAPYKWETSPNPHTRSVFRVFVNSIGKLEMLKRGIPNFPDGTVVVKEKFDRDLVDPVGYGSLTLAQRKQVVQGKPVLVTVMIKEQGEWSYFSVDKNGKRVEGSVKHCVDCHEVAKKGDFVFRPYVTGAPSMPKIQ